MTQSETRGCAARRTGEPRPLAAKYARRDGSMIRWREPLARQRPCMKIKSIRLQRFRQFADTTFEVGAFNLLVGPNNSGKTSLLHAVRTFFYLMHGHVRFEGDPPAAVYHRRFLSSAEEVAPTPDIRELWYKLQTG